MFKKAEWITVERPGWFGEEWRNMVQSYDEKYGPHNWRIRHQLGPRYVELQEALRLYEICYELHYLNPETRYLWLNLFRDAVEIWTEEEADFLSGMDYSIQNAKAPHYEDVAIRIIMQRYGMQFRGDRLIRIRADSLDAVGVALSSIHIPFLFPEFIEPVPEKHWWNRHGGTLECFWHSNKVLQIRN